LPTGWASTSVYLHWSGLKSKNDRRGKTAGNGDAMGFPMQSLYYHCLGYANESEYDSQNADPEYSKFTMSNNSQPYTRQHPG